MEYIVGIAVVAAIIYLLSTNKKKEAVVETQPEAAPYKVETPEAKVEAVNAQSVAKEEAKPAKAKKAPAKKAAPKAAKAKAPAKAKAAPKAKKPKA